MGVFCSPPASWMAVMRGAGPCAAMARSKDLALTLFQWRATVDTADAAVLLCMYVLQGQPFFGLVVPILDLGKKH